MKKVLILCGLLLAASGVLFAQTARVVLPGNATLLKSGKYAALEVDGKRVVDFDDEFVDIKTDKGKYFAAEEADGGFLLLDRTGEDLSVGGKRRWAKIALVDGKVMVYEEADGKPRFFSQDDLVKEIVAEQVGGNFFEEQVEKKGGVSMVLSRHRRAVDAAQEACAQVDPVGRFELRSNERGTLDLVVDGKVLLSAADFRPASDAAYYKETNCWFFIVIDSNYSPKQYGVFAISMYMKEGKKEIESKWFIPYGVYSHIERIEGTRMALQCSTPSLAQHRCDFWGWEYEVNKEKQVWERSRRWTQDGKTGKWALKPVE